MNLYKVTRTDYIGYDEYVEFVCSAQDEEQARSIAPWGALGEVAMVGWDPEVRKWGWHWADTINDVQVELIGVADAKFTKPQIISASFNAG